MKHYFNTSASLLLFFLLFSSCSKDDSEDRSDDLQKPAPVPSPIAAVRVEHYPDASVRIDDEEQTIDISFDSPARLSNMWLEFDLSGNVTLPGRPTAINLLDEYVLKVKNNGAYQDYTVRANAKEPDFGGWVPDESFGTLPSYIDIYKSTRIQGRNGLAYIAVIDLSADFGFRSLGNKRGVKTPSRFYEELPASARPSVLINSGYFTYNTTDGNYGVSLLVQEGVTKRTNTTRVTRSDQQYYITRSAVGFERGKPFEINWVYTDNTSSPTYAYPAPSPNIDGQLPMQKPSEIFPFGGKKWHVYQANGAGPIAAKYGKVLSLDKMQLEMLTGDGGAQRPRSAIGLTSDHKMVIYVNQGNGFDGYYGYTWEEVARELVKLGCYDVMHFDGGGSTCMLVNGKPVIKGGEVPANNPTGTVQRAVASVVTID